MSRLFTGGVDRTGTLGAPRPQGLQFSPMGGAVWEDESWTAEWRTPILMANVCLCYYGIRIQ